MYSPELRSAPLTVYVTVEEVITVNTDIKHCLNVLISNLSTILSVKTFTVK